MNLISTCYYISAPFVSAHGIPPPDIHTVPIIPAPIMSSEHLHLPDEEGTKTTKSVPRRQLTAAGEAARLCELQSFRPEENEKYIYCISCIVLLEYKNEVKDSDKFLAHKRKILAEIHSHRGCEWYTMKLLGKWHKRQAAYFRGCSVSSVVRILLFSQTDLPIYLRAPVEGESLGLRVSRLVRVRP